MTALATGINPDTGEIGYFVPAGEGYDVRSPEQRRAGRRHFDRQRQIDYGRKADFTFAAMEEIVEVTQELTTAQCGYLLVLQCYVGYEDGRLVNANKTPMTTADMMAALQLKRKRQTFYDFLRKCIDNDIITEAGGGYAVNPRYHFRGAIENRAVVRSYTAKVKAVYREVKAADLGLIYRMLPYVHYGTNALCGNPSERDPLKIEWFNGKELADAIGVHEKSLPRSLTRMKFGDEYVIARLKIGDTMKYVFNPNVFYRKSTPPDDTLVAMFNVSNRKR